MVVLTTSSRAIMISAPILFYNCQEIKKITNEAVKIKRLKGVNLTKNKHFTNRKKN